MITEDNCGDLQNMEIDVLRKVPRRLNTRTARDPDDIKACIRLAQAELCLGSGCSIASTTCIMQGDIEENVTPQRVDDNDQNFARDGLNRSDPMIIIES